MKKIFALTVLTLFSFSAFSSALDSIKREKWNDIEVVWLEDSKFPKFHADIYFSDGAINDNTPGITQATFDQLSFGTSKESRKELAEFFDFYGAKVRPYVSHEYSVVSVQGLLKDIKPVFEKVCELFNDAQYPAHELSSYVSRSKSALRNLVTNHAGLAERVFRKQTLQGTPYVSPVEGNLGSFDKLTSAGLKARLTSLNSAKKKIYLSGPSEVKKLKDIIKNCQWKSEHQVATQKVSKPASQSTIYLVPVEGANQAQIRIGRVITPAEFNNKEVQFSFLSGFLGGNFTSKLVQELRVKRGLTYSAGAYVSTQRDYGRAGVSTFSKTETAAETISVIRDIFTELSAGKITPEEFKHQQGNQIGSFSFGFEETSAFLGQVLIYDHQGRDLKELFGYPEKVKSLTTKSLSQANIEAFPWEKLTIVVVGDKSLEKSLSRIRPVKVLNFQDFL